MKGATLGCLNRFCRSSYHLSCARASNCELNGEPYNVMCPLHQSSEPRPLPAPCPSNPGPQHHHNQPKAPLGKQPDSGGLPPQPNDEARRQGSIPNRSLTSVGHEQVLNQPRSSQQVSVQQPHMPGRPVSLASQQLVLQHAIGLHMASIPNAARPNGSVLPITLQPCLAPAVSPQRQWMPLLVHDGDPLPMKIPKRKRT